MTKILITEPTGGRPKYADEQYQKWLEDMRVFLRQGHTLWYAIDKAGLSAHITTIYEKYRSKDWFSQKIDRLQATITELNNSVIFKVIERAHDRFVESNAAQLTREEAKTIELVARHHRTSQSHFTNRAEIAPAKDEDFGKVIEPSIPTITYIYPEGQNDENREGQAGDSVQGDAEAASGVVITDGQDNE